MPLLGLRTQRNDKNSQRTSWNTVSTPIITVTQAYESQLVQEPSVIYEAGTWKMWYTGANVVLATVHGCLNYATCTGDPTVAANWTKYASNPVIGSSGSGFAEGACVTKVGSTYYAYWYDATGGGNIKVATSSDGVTWGAPTTALASNAAAWTHGWTNSFVWNEGGSTWKMLVEGPAASQPPLANVSYATSTDGLAWTVQGSGFVSGLAQAPGTTAGAGAPSVVKLGSTYHLWVHGSTVAGYSAIFHAHSTDAQTWTIDSTNPEISAPSGAFTQAADPSVVEANGTSYCFFAGCNQVTPASAIGSIYVATYPSTLANLVLWEP